MNKKNKSTSNWVETDVENQTPKVDVENINTFTYEEEDVIVVNQNSSNDEFTFTSEFTSHVQPTNKRKILHNVDDNSVVKKSRTCGQQNNLLFNGKYFVIISKTATRIEAKCMCCGNPLKGYGGVSSNFITHLRNVRFIQDLN